MKDKQRLILALESSCDETAAAVLLGDIISKNPKFKILSSIVNSQITLHRKTGGVVPEVAARAHIQNIRPVTELALRRAKIKLHNIDYLAVTSGPGLIVSLLVGVEFVKGLAIATGKPTIPVNHMAGHLYSAFVPSTYPPPQGRKKETQFPALALVVSGGHTMLILMKDYLHYQVIGQTVDDAAGEAFDKVARLLKLPYPGGPSLSKLARDGEASIAFPRPMLNENNYNFSFSGLKTAVRYFLDDQQKDLSPKLKANVAASFQQAVIDVLITKTLRAAKKYACRTVALAGGVAANETLRLALATACRENKLDLAIAASELCTDNAAMIAVAAYFQLRSGPVQYPVAKIKADSGWEL